MRDYLWKVLELTKPYRFRLTLGLLCGLLSGTLALALPLSLKLAVDTVFPATKAAPLTPDSAAQANTNGRCGDWRIGRGNQRHGDGRCVRPDRREHAEAGQEEYGQPPAGAAQAQT